MDEINKGAAHQGTYNGNPLSVAASLATLTKVLTPDAYVHFGRLGKRLADGMKAAIEANGIGMEPSQVRKVDDSPASRGRVAVRPDYCAHVDSVVNCRAYFASGESGAAQ